MSTEAKKRSLADQLGKVERRAVDMSSRDWVLGAPLLPGSNLPWTLQPKVENLSLRSWLEGHREEVLSLLREHGGLLFRGFEVEVENELEALVKTLSPELLDYTFRSTPRTRVRGNVFTSTEYPSELSIPMHNEMSYTRVWPAKIWFLAVTPAAEGGETPLADSHRVYRRLDSELVARFERLGILYVRNFGDHLDLPWEGVFQTDSRAKVETYCVNEGIEFEWKPGNRLRTRQRCQAVLRHPDDGRPLWFNQAHLFHVSSLPEALRQTLLSSYTEDDLPRNTYYGDGTPIEEEALAAVREAFTAELVVFPWQRGDVVLLDNMAVAHGRRPFVGPRRLLAGMAEPVRGEQRWPAAGEPEG